MRKIFILLLTLILLLIPGCIIPGCSMSTDGGVFKSEDGGDTWKQKVIIDEKTTIAGLNIRDIEISKDNSQIIYIGTSGAGMYKTENGGDSWQKIVDQDHNLASNATIYDITQDPQRSDILYVASFQGKQGKVPKSSNQGESWGVIYRQAKQDVSVTQVKVNPKNPESVYITTSNGGILESTDYGTTWRPLKWFDKKVTELVIDQYDPKTLYVILGSQSIMKSGDGGVMWQELTLDKKEYNVKTIYEILLDPSRKSVIYFTSNYGLFRSTDRGDSWSYISTPVAPDSVSIMSLVIDPRNSNTIYFGADSIIYKSEDFGKNWKTTEIPTKRGIKILVMDPENSNIIYAGTYQTKESGSIFFP